MCNKQQEFCAKIFIAILWVYTLFVGFFYVFKIGPKFLYIQRQTHCPSPVNILPFFNIPISNDGLLLSYIVGPIPFFSICQSQNPLKVDSSYQTPVVLTRHMLPHLDFEPMKETCTILHMCAARILLSPKKP